jgi:pilus assembly protein CpaD
MPFREIHKKVSAASLLLFLALMGCTPESARWTPAEAPKENKVDFVVIQHQVHFLPGSATMATDETKSLSAFIDDIALSYGDQVTVDAGSRAGTVAGDSLAAKRLESVRTALRRLQVRAQPATRPTVDGALARDAVVVAIGRYVVTGPKCPDRSKPEPDDFTNTVESNYGCATATNLGLMVANPGDLVHGTVAGPADADFAARGVQLYRSGGISKTLAPAMSSGGGGN